MRREGLPFKRNFQEAASGCRRANILAGLRRDKLLPEAG
jgi:hypothetical protein